MVLQLTTVEQVVPSAGMTHEPGAAEIVPEGAAGFDSSLPITSIEAIVSLTTLRDLEQTENITMGWSLNPTDLDGSRLASLNRGCRMFEANILNVKDCVGNQVSRGPGDCRRTG